jgi:HD-GYP domain-containing protein (c-di-GMP phosphodiesterase class II)
MTTPPARPVRVLRASEGFDLFQATITAIDNRDGYTRKHSEDVTAFSLQIARALGLSEEMLQTIEVAGLLHDVARSGCRMRSCGSRDVSRKQSSG